jgi:GR25 family glycosyltransferase involved in LPS biosynthesis
MSGNIKIKAYVIYLEKNLSRLENVEQLLKHTNARIFPAIDGRLINFQKLSPQTLVNSDGPKSSSEIKSDSDEKGNLSGGQGEQNAPVWFIHLGSHLFPHIPEFLQRLKKLRLGYNEAGCLLSHYYLWHYLATTLGNDEVGLIMEDDAICDDPSGFLKSIQDLPALDTWDLCQLFTTASITRGESVSKGFFKGPKTFNRASAYLLTQGGAQSIIKNSGSLNVAADDHLCLLTVSDHLRTIFPENVFWNHMERNCGWNSSLWDSEHSYLHVEWNRPVKNSWIGIRLGNYTGLANQMFQWAAAKIQSMRLGTHLIVEAGPQCLLQLFPYIRDWQEWYGTPPEGAGKSFRTKHHLFPKQWESGKEWNEKNLAYDPTIEELTTESSWKLVGYMQSIKYFEPYLPLLRMIFAFDEKVQERCRAFLGRIDRSPKIAVHLRLPNLSSEPIENCCYACPTTEFVYASMDKMLSMFPGAHFILCSNDPQRCRTIYNFDKWSTSWPELGLMEDMAVMSMCDHFILSASTYGWWAAMLSDNSEKKVIMSKPFFGPNYENLNEHHNLILPGWIVYDMKKNSFEEGQCLVPQSLVRSN